MPTAQPIETRFATCGVYVFESHHAADFRMKADRWDFHKLCVIQQGRGRIVHENGTASVASNDVIFMPALSRHKFEDDPSDPLSLMMACYYEAKVMGDVPWAETARSFGDRFPCATAFPLHDSYRTTVVTNAFQAMLLEQTRQTTGWEEMVCTQLLGVMIFLARINAQRQAFADQDPEERRFAASMDLLDNEFQRPIRVEELAEVAGLTYRAYTHRFKQVHGQTVTQYLTRMRIDYAKLRLIKSGNVLHSAAQAGFGDLAHFYRVFKRATGITPRQFLDAQSRQD
ncbi:MAG: AraC family transcriptional regulator [Planctomycetota bacterium]